MFYCEEKLDRNCDRTEISHAVLFLTKYHFI